MTCGDTLTRRAPGTGNTVMKILLRKYEPPPPPYFSKFSKFCHTPPHFFLRIHFNIMGKGNTTCSHQRSYVGKYGLLVHLRRKQRRYSNPLLLVSSFRHQLLQRHLAVREKHQRMDSTQHNCAGAGQQ